MDVNFETSSGGKFTMEIWFFATVLEIKENIKKYHGIPVSNQTLIFNNQVLADDRNTEYYGILQGSHIRLNVEPDEPESEKVPQQQTPPPQEPARITILIKILQRQFPVEAVVTDTVASLKEKIHESEGIPLNRFVLALGTTELQDERTLVDYQIGNGSEVRVIVKIFPPASMASASSGPKKLRVMVLPPQPGANKVPVEVNASDNVSELRKELQKIYHLHNFHLPSDGYFFIYKQNVMDEDRSFRWHDVRQGETIEVFNGSVTGGAF